LSIKDEWVVGYGMDDENGYSRNLDGVFALWDKFRILYNGVVAPP
jgi:hypoxanthine-guanine phosphoribosyltransferase